MAKGDNRRDACHGPLEPGSATDPAAPMLPGIEHPIDVIAHTLKRFYKVEELDEAYVASHIICALEHGGYPITCLYKGYVKLTV